MLCNYDFFSHHCYTTFNTLKSAISIFYATFEFYYVISNGSTLLTLLCTYCAKSILFASFSNILRKHNHTVRIVEDNFFLLLLLCQSSNKNLTEGKAKVITDGWMPHQPFSARMIWRKGWIEEETLGRMDALEKMDDHPVHYPPKMDVLPKISLLIIYAAK